MIIKCINCNKKFNVNQNLIPEHGRLIECGSCNHVWHYNTENLITDPIAIDENIIQKEKKKLDGFEIIQDNYAETTIKEKITKEHGGEKITKTNEAAKTPKSSNFFSYLIVFIISTMALVILIDTLKLPLIELFPGLEIILFNFFETLKDIKLFLIDLT